MRTLAIRTSPIATLLLLAACGSPSDPDGGIPEPDGGLDMAVAMPDEGPIDEGVEPDEGPPDEGVTPDEGPLPDEGQVDQGVDLGVDEGVDMGEQPDMEVDMGLPQACPEFDLGMMVGDAVTSGAMMGASDSTAPSMDCSGGLVLDGVDVAYTWTAPADAPFTFRTQESQSDTVVYLLDGHAMDCTGAELICNDDIDFRSLKFGSSVQIRLDMGDEVTIVIDSKGTTGIPYTLDIEQGEGVCDDDLDDDLDGRIDCRDPDCDIDPICVETICDDGLDNEDDGDTDCDDTDCFGTVPCPLGSIVLMGHDMDGTPTTATQPAEDMLGNALIDLTNETGTIDILYYNEWVDPGTFTVSEDEKTRDIIDEQMVDASRTYVITDLADSGTLSSNLDSTIDVFLVPEQESAPFREMLSVAPTWETDLLDFIDTGGIIIVLSSFDEEWRLVSEGTEMLSITNDSSLFTGTIRITSAGSSDPVGTGVAGYSVFTQTHFFVVPGGGSGGTTIAETTASQPVVIHLDY